MASLSDIAAEATDDPMARKHLFNPYSLALQPQKGPQKDRLLPRHDKDQREWSAPFIMAPINSRVVQRSHALSGKPWGVEFCYDEAMSTGHGEFGWVKAVGITANLGGLVGLGPSLQSIYNGFFELHAIGQTPKGQKLCVVIRGDRDPGYGATSRMLGEAALCLADDCDNQYVGGGFWTPSTAMGQTLLDHLTRHAGMSFQETML